jgi:hypothetical protein
VTNIDPSGFIGEAGGLIRIEAEDDFEVAGVRVRVLESGGGLIEEGAAVPISVSVPVTEAQRSKWKYVTTVAVPAGKAVLIEAEACDLAGNRAAKVVDHLCRGV